VLCVVLWKNLSNYQRDYDAAKAAGAPDENSDGWKEAGGSRLDSEGMTGRVVSE
jgi:hypothetical protein